MKCRNEQPGIDDRAHQLPRAGRRQTPGPTQQLCLSSGFERESLQFLQTVR